MTRCAGTWHASGFPAGLASLVPRHGLPVLRTTCMCPRVGCARGCVSQHTALLPGTMLKLGRLITAGSNHIWFPPSQIQAESLLHAHYLPGTPANLL